jgi:hypothetical protein
MLQRGNLIVQIENLECSGYWAVGEDEKEEGKALGRSLFLFLPDSRQAHAYSGARFGKLGPASGFLFPD